MISTLRHQFLIYSSIGLQHQRFKDYTQVSALLIFIVVLISVNLKSNEIILFSTRIGKLFRNSVNKNDSQAKHTNERLFKEKEYDS